MKSLVIPNRILENLGKDGFYDLCILCLYLTQQASTKDLGKADSQAGFLELCILSLDLKDPQASTKETHNSR
jgi:hypothetical protein